MIAVSSETIRFFLFDLPNYSNEITLPVFTIGYYVSMIAWILATGNPLWEKITGTAAILAMTLICLVLLVYLLMLPMALINTIKSIVILVPYYNWWKHVKMLRELHRPSSI